MRNINVGINLETLDQFQYLPRSWESENIKINIIDISKNAIEEGVCISSSELSDNPIDLYFHPATSLLDAPDVQPNHVSFRTHTKPKQLQFLHQLKLRDEARPEKEKRYPHLYVQQYVEIKTNCNRQLLKRQYSRLQSLIEVSPQGLVLKPNFGACGRGVCLIENQEITSITASVLASPNWVESHAPDQIAYDYYLKHGGHLSERIEGFTEYRIVKSSRGDLISVKRENNATETSNGLEIGRVGTANYYSAVLRNTIEKPICGEIVNLLDDLEPMIRTGSFDLWIKQSEDKILSFGLFEFSTQYALNYCMNDLRLDFLKSVVEKYVMDYIAG